MPQQTEPQPTEPPARGSVETGDGPALPPDLTRLVGREPELAELGRLLPRARLVTLTGVGGVGKTRLARHVARSVAPNFTDGVRFVALAELTEPELLPQVASTALGAPPAESAEALADSIGDRHLLLVLDNLEHLADASAQVIMTLLSRCENLHILATSREAMRLHGETRFQVQPLGLPDEQADGPPGWASRFPAVMLFVERARAHNPGFALTGANESVVVELCRRLDGVPLALELAASATRWLPVEVVASMSAEPLALPEEGVRGGEDRHVSLRATLDYSNTLCSPHGRTLWGRFSVFQGGATLAAITRVCADDELSPARFNTALAELIEQSLLVFESPRYRMLETVRQYGAELLRDAGMESQVRQAHLRQVSDLAARVSAGWFSGAQQSLLAEVRADLANVRAALEFALREPGLSEVGLRLTTDLWSFWVGCGLPSEGRLWLDRLLGSPEVSVEEHPDSLWVAGYLAVLDGEEVAARGYLEQALAVSREVGDVAIEARAIQALAMVAVYSGRFADALACFEQGVELQRRSDPADPHLADGLILWGQALCDLGEFDRATVVLEEARDLCEANNEQLLCSWSKIFLGLVALKQGRFDVVLTGLREAVATQGALGNWQGIVWAVEVAAWAELANGDARRSAQLFGASEAVSTGHGPHLHGARPMLAERTERLASAREALGDSEFECLFQRGRNMSLADVVTLVSGKAPARPEEETPVGGDLEVLTRREREIATMLATGMTNKDIAAELVIARRTVDSHVEHILSKLGFTSRAQVAALVAESRSR